MKIIKKKKLMKQKTMFTDDYGIWIRNRFILK